MSTDRPTDSGSWLIGDPDEDKALARMIWYPFIAATLLLPLGLRSIAWFVAMLALDAVAWLGFTMWKRRRRRSPQA
ncbi:MAG: hypothetical protein OXG57_10660 [Acidimicrobiaceae bacterium]|nr:hypothetical protein [Acidimicrobiaceae bacterium]